jgi:hypothetical protein
MCAEEQVGCWVVVKMGLAGWWPFQPSGFSRSVGIEYLSDPMLKDRHKAEGEL